MKKYKSRFSNSVDAAFSRPFSPGQYLANVSAVVVAYGVLLTSYLGLIYTESFSALMMDSWCDPKTEGIGKHCFSDFYSVKEISNSNNPWQSGSTYPPLPILIVKAISQLGGRAFTHPTHFLLNHFDFWSSRSILSYEKTGFAWETSD